MRGILSKVIVLITTVFLYLVVKEMYYLYSILEAFHPFAPYIGFGIIGLFLIYFAIIPFFQIFILRVAPGPVKNRSKEEGLIQMRLKNFRTNPYLLSIGFDFTSLSDDRKAYEKVIEVLGEEAIRIRESYVRTIFYATATAQNGFLDALIVLSANIKMIKSIFILYNGRVSTKELLNIGKKVIFAVVAGGSEVAEYATEELLSKLGTETMKSIPFLDKIMSSVMDGYVNAILLTRVSLITENYCKLTYIENEATLRPGTKVVMHTADLLLKETYKDVKKYIKKRINVFRKSNKNTKE